MKLFVGLGNPGARYAGTRHNVGWMAVDAISQAHGFGPPRGKFQGEVREGRLGGEKVLILKPHTFMNLSGNSVGEAARFHKIPVADIVAFHDELDLAPGKLKLKTGGGHAGHNGLRSMHQHLGPDYARVRIGIGHPGDKALVANYVLHDFAKADEAWLNPLLDGVAEGAAKLAAGDGPGFQNAVALRMAPSKPRKPGPPAADVRSGETAGEAGPAKSPFDALKRLIGD